MYEISTRKVANIVITRSSVPGREVQHTISYNRTCPFLGGSRSIYCIRICGSYKEYYVSSLVDNGMQNE